MRRLRKKLFNQALNTSAVHQLLMSPQYTASQNYNLRPHKHDKELGLPKKTTHLTDCNCINNAIGELPKLCVKIRPDS